MLRKQTGSLVRAFARHQKTQPSNKVKEWRKALKEVADLAGMVLQNQADGYKALQNMHEASRSNP
ncbi:PREDICTED: TMV resistance N [Prunus dulcis]|uniref:PREDICTED: TMV resistance N n=1 Tax=Prunus dulcis TaxID=3755 RepID=A0A5E4GCC9_PRUDU|nr:PREDICTED: TMV resistance N [Prunus dulcis]